MDIPKQNVSVSASVSKAQKEETALGVTRIEEKARSTSKEAGEVGGTRWRWTFHGLCPAGQWFSVLATHQNHRASSRHSHAQSHAYRCLLNRPRLGLLLRSFSSMQPAWRSIATVQRCVDYRPGAKSTPWCLRTKHGFTNKQLPSIHGSKHY